ncbi:MAG: hypothetical protein Q8R02_21065 [Hyphomonadaceae bacterium]|nr:hypothetical protein [Hyphomonadaceae bacterium]
MLFNSFEFLFAFLPACLLLTYVSAAFGGRGFAKLVLIAMSLVFYG